MLIMEPDKSINLTFVKVEPEPEDDNDDDFIAENFVDVNIIENINDERLTSNILGGNYIHIKPIKKENSREKPTYTSTEENYNESCAEDDKYSTLNEDESSDDPLALGVPVNTEYSRKNECKTQNLIEEVFLIERYPSRRGRRGRKPSGLTPEEKRELQRIRRKERRHAMSEEKRAIQRIKIRERVRKSRLMQSEEEKAYQKMMDRERKRKLRGGQTQEERELERMKNRERMRRARLLQTEEERAWENLKARDRKRRMRARLRRETLETCEMTGLLQSPLWNEPSQLLEIEYREDTQDLCK